MTFEESIARRSQAVLEDLLSAPSVGQYVENRTVPVPFLGEGEIRLIVLGQDPTVKNEKSRAGIRTVLNLDKEGSLKRYLRRICQGLGIGLEENVYATNVVKNFFCRSAHAH